MEKYKWKFKSVGGTSRIDISSGEDIKHLGELDQKLWTVLSCPTVGLEFDQKTLDIIDSDKDGKIRIGEIVAVADYLTSVIKDADLILKQEDHLDLSQFRQENPQGKRLYDSAKQILLNLGLDKDSISLSDTADSVAIFAKTRFNGDGVITPLSSEDPALRSAIEAAVAATGGTPDRSGVQGVNAGQVEAFYGACADYSAWVAAGKDSSVLAYGDNTEAALSAVNALYEKISDYFMRCRLAAFDSESTAALDVQVAKISEISSGNLAQCSEQIASYPIARVTGASFLPYNGINPAWQAEFSKLKTLVLDVDFPGKDSLSETDWNQVQAKLAKYSSWKSSKKGGIVESLGLERVERVLAADGKTALLDLLSQDKALETEAEGIDDVDKLLRLYKNFYCLLRNYVTFDDFFDKDSLAVFQAGKLFIDQRSLDLCIRVSDLAKHGDMSGLSGMFIIYCSCVSKASGKSMNVAAVLTDGDVDNLRVGMNAVFYDRNGVDYDAVVTKIVDNPVSVRQAFWAPYRKLGRTITERINKAAVEKNNKVDAGLTAKASSATIPTTKEELAAAKANAAPVQSFDIAKFAGIFAALGMALGMIGSALMKLIDPWYNLLTLAAVLVVCISGPSMFIAWQKLRKRNLAPVLNANGWAINARVLVNISFGAGLTSLAKFPALTLVDPSAKLARNRRRLWSWIILAFLLAAGTYCAYFFLTRDRSQQEDEDQVVLVDPLDSDDGVF